MRDRLAVADDDPGVLHVLRVRLRAAGCEVRTAADGAAGLDAVKTHHPAGVVLDLRMPVMDGLAVLSRLREDETPARSPSWCFRRMWLNGRSAERWTWERGFSWRSRTTPGNWSRRFS